MVNRNPAEDFTTTGNTVDVEDETHKAAQNRDGLPACRITSIYKSEINMVTQAAGKAN